MKRAVLISLLAGTLPALAAPAAAEPDWVQPACRAAQELSARWQQESLAVDATLKDLDAHESGREGAADDDFSPAPEDSIATCMGGLYFDSDTSTLVYMDRVLLTDSRLHLYAANRLFIRLPQGSKPADTKADKDTAPAAQPRKGKSLDQPEKATARAEEQLTGNIRQMPGSVTGGTVRVQATDAVADADANCLLLLSPAGAGPLLVTQGANSIRIEPQEDKPALMLADAEGNLVLRGAHISMRWEDEEGNTGKLESAGGCLVYHAADHTAYLGGHSSMQHPRGSFTCEQGLCVQMDAAPAAKKPNGDFLSQFSAMQFRGLVSVSAAGNVKASFDSRYAACGDRVDYNAQTGACAVQGADCFLRYDANSLVAGKEIRIHENGDIDALGASVSGTYSRTAADGKTALSGIFSGQELHFCAAEGAVSTTGPFRAKDPELDFSCAGPVRLTLHRKPTPAQARPGMPCPALLDYDTVETIHAEQSVQLAALSPQGDISAAADLVDANLTTRTATLMAAQGNHLVLQGRGYRAAAKTVQDGQSSLDLAQDGAITLAGEHISIDSTAGDRPKSTIVAVSRSRKSTLSVDRAGDITLLGDDIGMETAGTGGRNAKARCKESLHLDKARGCLTTAGAATVQADQGTFSANGPVTAFLAQGPAPRKPADDRFAHLSYNFTGITALTTASGGSMRTQRASMQCTGPMELQFRPDSAPRPAQDSPYGNLQEARAEGHVELAAKDKDGAPVYAAGDTLTLDAATGTARLTGSTVTLSDRFNTHTAGGKGAAVTIDSKYNARISGATQRTTATKIHDQIDNRKKER